MEDTWCFAYSSSDMIEEEQWEVETIMQHKIWVKWAISDIITIDKVQMKIWIFFFINQLYNIDMLIYKLFLFLVSSIHNL